MNNPRHRRADRSDGGAVRLRRLRAMAPAGGSDDWALVDAGGLPPAQGFGAVARTWFLTWTAPGWSRGEPDLVDLDDLAGLEDQRRRCWRTPGLPARRRRRTCCCTAAGHGKSSLVRAGTTVREPGSAWWSGRDRLGTLACTAPCAGTHSGSCFHLDDLSFRRTTPIPGVQVAYWRGVGRTPPDLVLYVTSPAHGARRWSDRNGPKDAEVHGRTPWRSGSRWRTGSGGRSCSCGRSGYLRIVGTWPPGLPIGRGVAKLPAVGAVAERALGPDRGSCG